MQPLAKTLSDSKTVVSIIGITIGGIEGVMVDELCVAGALGCFEEKSSIELLKDLMELDPDVREAKIEKLCAETSGRGHGSVLDQGSFIFSIENLPRSTTLQLCLPEYASHLQQSLRRASADRGYALTDSIKNSPYFDRANQVMENAFKFYADAAEAGVPLEDARYPLPLGTRTNIQTLVNPRELMHLHAMAGLRSVDDITSEVIGTMVMLSRLVAPNIMKERENNYNVFAWRPSSQLFGAENFYFSDHLTCNYVEELDVHNAVLLDHPRMVLPEGYVDMAVNNKDESYLSLLKHQHFTFLTLESLACFHQATRQRTWNHSVEPIKYAALRNTMVLPESIKKAHMDSLYTGTHEDMVTLYRDMINNGIPEGDAALVLPHSLMVHDLIHVDGWNALHSISKRTCTTAQWEIRKIANRMANLIRETGNPIGKYVVPQGVLYGKCPERENCGLCVNATIGKG